MKEPCATETPCPGKGDCSGNGVCHRGKCECDFPFAGVDCSAERSCPNDCHGRGLCSAGRCYCEPGASGIDCAEGWGCAARITAAAESFGLCGLRWSVSGALLGPVDRLVAWE